MGYRDDDAALVSQRDALKQELETIEAVRRDADAQVDALKRMVTHERASLAAKKVGGWLSPRPVIVALLIPLVWLFAQGLFTEKRKQREQRERYEALGKGCSARLRIASTPSCSRAYVDSVWVGGTPLEMPICPGSHLVRLHCGMPWQKQILVTKGGATEVNAKLYKRVPRWGAADFVVNTNPPGAVLFVDGRQHGQTPALVKRPDRSKSVTIGIWSDASKKPVFVWKGNPRDRQVWFNLASGGGR